jgi:hypothetical protein
VPVTRCFVSALGAIMLVLGSDHSDLHRAFYLRSYGGDLSSECIASGSVDTLGYSLSRCRALCAADPVCTGFTYTTIAKECTKKCPSGFSILVCPFTGRHRLCAAVLCETWKPTSLASRRTDT